MDGYTIEDLINKARGILISYEGINNITYNLRGNVAGHIIVCSDWSYSINIDKSKSDNDSNTRCYNRELVIPTFDAGYIEAEFKDNDIDFVNIPDEYICKLRFTSKDESKVESPVNEYMKQKYMGA